MFPTKGALPACGRSPAPCSRGDAFERSVYAPSGTSRVGGIAGTATIFVALASVALLTFNHALPMQEAAHLTVLEVSRPALPEEAPAAEPPPPEQEMSAVEPAEAARVREPVIAIADAGTVAAPVSTAARDPVSPEPSAPAPPLAPAPPPARVRSGQEAKTWEDRVLATLVAARRYPRLAMARRQQGVPYVRFTVDRRGRVLSSRVDRSSGHAELDREAATLPRRVSPLPPPPEDRAGEIIELLVPIEFFIG